MTIPSRFMTAEEFERTRLPDGLWEVIDGKLLEVSPSGGVHTAITGTVIFRLSDHVTSARLGTILLPTSGIVLAEEPLTMRSPDTGVIRADRLPLDQIPHGLFRVIPDLAVEVISHGEPASEVLDRVMTWVEAGVKLLWVIAAEKAVFVFAAGQQPHMMTIEHTLDGGDVLPGFQLPVRDIFAV